MEHDRDNWEVFADDPMNIVKDVHRSVYEVRKFTAAYRTFISARLPPTRTLAETEPPLVLKTCDSGIDRLLAGGLRVGSLTEISGEAGVGKTGLVAQISLAAQKVTPVVIFISTEDNLWARRIEQIAPRVFQASLDRIIHRKCNDLEDLETLVFGHLPALIRHTRTRLIIIDSIANVMLHKHLNQQQMQNGSSSTARDYKLYSHLKKLAGQFGVAIVSTNHVSDWRRRNLSPEVHPNALYFENQARWLNGSEFDLLVDPECGPPNPKIVKVPKLGYTWTSQLDQRIVLERNFLGSGRIMKLVFSSWAAPSTLEFDIDALGLWSREERECDARRRVNPNP